MPIIPQRSLARLGEFWRTRPAAHPLPSQDRFSEAGVKSCQRFVTPPNMALSTLLSTHPPLPQVLNPDFVRATQFYTCTPRHLTIEKCRTGTPLFMADGNLPAAGRHRLAPIWAGTGANAPCDDDASPSPTANSESSSLTCHPGTAAPSSTLTISSARGIPPGYRLRVDLLVHGLTGTTRPPIHPE